MVIPITILTFQTLQSEKDTTYHMYSVNMIRFMGVLHQGIEKKVTKELK